MWKYYRGKKYKFLLHLLHKKNSKGITFIKICLTSVTQQIELLNWAVFWYFIHSELIKVEKIIVHFINMISMMLKFKSRLKRMKCHTESHYYWEAPAMGREQK